MCWWKTPGLGLHGGHDGGFALKHGFAGFTVKILVEGELDGEEFPISATEGSGGFRLGGDLLADGYGLEGGYLLGGVDGAGGEAELFDEEAEGAGGEGHGGHEIMLGVEGGLGIEGVEIFGHEFGRGGPVSQ